MEKSAPQAVARGSVPVFSLYGEPLPAARLELLHIENIRSRSERHDWHIEPHLHQGLFQVLVILEGSADVDVDGRHWHVTAPASVSIPPGVIHAFKFRRPSEGYVFTIAEALLATGGRHRGLADPLFIMPHVISFEKAPEVAARIAALLAQVTAEVRDRGPGQAPILECLVDATLLLLARQLAAAAQSEPAGQRLREFKRFRALVEAHFLDHWPVPRYAQALRSTEGKLNRLCRAIAGATAFDVIQERLLLEARRRLTYVAVPVSTLSYELGFEDPAYFSRFFKNHVGVTPSQFRRSSAARR